MTNPITKGIIALATAMGYGDENSYRGTSVAEVLSEVFVNMGYGKKSDYKVLTVIDVLYDAAGIVKTSGGSDGTSAILDDLIEGKSGIHLVSNAESVADGAFSCIEEGDVNFGLGWHLESVNLPNATSIGMGAFSECSNLVSVDIPNVTSIGDYAFRGISTDAIINIGAAEGEISGAPWDAPNGVTINYNVR